MGEPTTTPPMSNSTARIELIARRPRDAGALVWHRMRVGKRRRCAGSRQSSWAGVRTPEHGRWEPKEPAQSEVACRASCSAGAMSTRRTLLELQSELLVTVWRFVVLDRADDTHALGRRRALSRLRRVSKALAGSESLRAIAVESQHFAIHVDSCQALADVLDFYDQQPSLGRHVRVVSIRLNDIYDTIFDEDAELEDDLPNLVRLMPELLSLHVQDVEWAIHNLPPTSVPLFASLDPTKMSSMWTRRLHELAVSYDRLAGLCPLFTDLCLSGYAAIGSLPLSCTSVSIETSDMGVLPALMARHPHLERFALDEAPDEDMDDDVEMPNMLSLAIMVSRFDLARFRAPKLRRLSLSSMSTLLSLFSAHELSGLAAAELQVNAAIRERSAAAA